MSCNNNPIKICSQTHIPQVDNSTIECSECGFISTQCIIEEEELIELGLSSGTSLKNIISTLITRLVEAESKIITLQSLT